MSVQYFDKKLPHCFRTGNLPHLLQDGTAVFVTYRLADSLPSDVMVEIKKAQADFIERHPKPWNDQTQRMYHRYGYNKYEGCLDQSHGSCILRLRQCRDVIVESLEYLHRTNLRLYAYVIMPNHVHLLGAPDGELDKIIESHKHYCATRINKITGQTGRLWQIECFDHAVRGPRSFARVLEYILHNPRYLPSTDYTLWFAEGYDPRNWEQPDE